MGGLRDDDPRTARIELRMAARGAEESFGSHHPETARALVALGMRAAAEDGLDEAEISLRRALAILQTQPDAEREEVAVVVRELGAVLRSAGRDEDAEHVLRWSERLDEDSSGPNGPQAQAARRSVDQ